MTSPGIAAPRATRHDHCGWCGVRFMPDAQWPRTCPGCGHTSYVNPLPVAVVLLPVGTGLLVVRRAIPPGLGELALPGGYIDHGERWQDAAAREVREETGVIIDPATVQHDETVSTTDGLLLVFGLAAPMDPDRLPAFVPNDEVSATEILVAPKPLAFPLHTRAMARYFARRAG